MNELRVLVVDDEQPAARRIQQLVDEVDRVQVVGTEHRALQVVDKCRELKPDVILLDVEMPGLNGIGLARELRRLTPAPVIVFVTAHEDYAVDAFELAAADYLLKPVRLERLSQALERARLRLNTRPAVLSARLGERLISIPVDRIRVLLAEDKYTAVHHVDGQLLIDESLVSLEQRFPERFIRAHRNALVSRDHLRGLFRDTDGADRIELEGVDLKPEVSRRNRSRIRRLLLGHTADSGDAVDDQSGNPS